MIIATSFVFLLPCLDAEPQEIGEAETLILVGFARDGIVMAADSGSFSDGHLMRRDARKIVPVGKFGAIGITGNVELDHKIDFRKILEQCATTADNIESAATCLTNKIKAVLPYGLQVPNVHENRLVRFYLAGYVRDNRESIELEYSIDPKTQLVESEPKMNMFRPDVGYFVGIGRNVVVSKAIHGGIPELKKNEAINTLLSRTAHGTLSLYTTTEMKILVSTLLNTTESELGRRYDKEAKFVARPNIVITIDPQRGVHSQRLP